MLICLLPPFQLYLRCAVFQLPYDFNCPGAARSLASAATDLRPSPSARTATSSASSSTNSATSSGSGTSTPGKPAASFATSGNDYFSLWTYPSKRVPLQLAWVILLWKHLAAFLIVDSLNRLKFNLAHQRLAFCLSRPGLRSSKFFLSSWVERGRKWNGTNREGWRDISSRSRNKISHIPAVLSMGEHSVSATQPNKKTLTATTNICTWRLFLF